MNESKKILIVLGVVLFIALGTVGFALSKNNNMKEMYERFESTYNDTKRNLIYIGAKHCSYCQLFNPTIDEMKDRYKFDYHYVDTDKLNETYFNNMLKKIDVKEFGTPYLVVTENGKKIDELIGVRDYNDLFLFLQKNGIISKESKLLLNYIDYQKYDEILKSNENSVIVIGQTTCPHCINAKLTLNKIVDEFNINVNYLNLSGMKKEDYEKLSNSLDALKSEFGTPLTLIVNNGQLIDKIEGGVSEKEFIRFFEKNNLIKR